MSTEVQHSPRDQVRVIGNSAILALKSSLVVAPLKQHLESPSIQPASIQNKEVYNNPREMQPINKETKRQQIAEILDRFNEKL